MYIKIKGHSPFFESFEIFKSHLMARCTKVDKSQAIFDWLQKKKKKVLRNALNVDTLKLSRYFFFQRVVSRNFFLSIWSMILGGKWMNKWINDDCPHQHELRNEVFSWNLRTNKSVDQELHNFSISHKKLKFRECSFVKLFSNFTLHTLFCR